MSRKGDEHGPRAVRSHPLHPRPLKHENIKRKSLPYKQKNLKRAQIKNPKQIFIQSPKPPYCINLNSDFDI
jgi:hypothetical protein